MLGSHIRKTTQRGFTLLEVLLVVAIIAILAGIVIIAINPGANLADTRNSQRYSNVSAIMSATYQYTIDNNGITPAIGSRTGAVAISAAATEVCATAPTNCTGLVDLAVLTNLEKYVTSIPKDPRCPTGCNVNGTGYTIAKNANGRLVVAAMNPEQGKTISITK